MIGRAPTNPIGDGLISRPAHTKGSKQPKRLGSVQDVGYRVHGMTIGFVAQPWMRCSYGSCLELDGADDWTI